MPNSIVLKTECVGSAPCNVAFKPAISLRAHVSGVTAGRRATAFHVTPNDQDQHVEIQSSVSGKLGHYDSAHGQLGIGFTSSLPPLGSPAGIADSVANVECGARYVDLDVAGKVGGAYELEGFQCGKSAPGATPRWPRWRVANACAATVANEEIIVVRFPAANSGEYAHRNIVLHFANRRK